MASTNCWKSTWGYLAFISFIQPSAKDLRAGMQPRIPHRRLSCSGAISHLATSQACSGCLESFVMAKVSALVGETTSPCGPAGTGATFQLKACWKVSKAYAIQLKH